MQSRYWLNRILALLGIWLIVAAFMLPFPDGVGGSPGLNSLLVGVLLIAIAVLTIIGGARWVDWLTVVLGIWLIVSPWLLGYGDAALSTWVHTMVGIGVVAISAASLRLKGKPASEELDS